MLKSTTSSCFDSMRHPSKVECPSLSLGPFRFTFLSAGFSATQMTLKDSMLSYLVLSFLVPYPRTSKLSLASLY